MKLAYCLNVFNDEGAIRNNISVINRNFYSPPIFVASNGITIDLLPKNVTFKKWGDNQGWQLGALNSCIESIKLAATILKDPEDYNIIFCHDDIYPLNIIKINSLLEELSDYDVILRKHIGKWSNNVPNHPYYMLDGFLFSGRILKKFLAYPTVTNLYTGAEELFGNIIWSMGARVKEVTFDFSKENQLGFGYYPRSIYENV